MPIALVTNYLPAYRVPLYQRLHERYGVEVHCFGGEPHYVSESLRDLDRHPSFVVQPPIGRRRGRRHASGQERAKIVRLQPHAGQRLDDVGRGCVTDDAILARNEQGGASEFTNFLTAVEGYAAFHWDHMRAEEKEILPLAEKHLSAGDWEAIDAAFLGHTDPMLGINVGAQFDTLFSRIVNLAPPPIGVGPVR